MSSPKKDKECRKDPYDISQDDEIIKESQRRTRRTSQRKKLDDATLKARESMMVKMEPVTKSEHEGVVVNEDGEYLCSTCPRSFKSLVGRQRHMGKCRLQEQDDQTCPCCHEKFDTAHQEGDITCSECSGFFISEQAFERHTEIIHKGATTLSCAVCPRIYYNKPDLIAHLATHGDEKPWMCKKCNSVFTRKYHLDRHFRQSGCDGMEHESNICQVCGRNFTRKDNLREHLRAHAGINKRLTVYTCEFCNEVISGLNNYNTHKRDLHVGNRPYKCNYCPFYFPTSGAMKKHQRRHTGERPYECRECFKKFAAKETLNRHMRLHTLDKPYKCELCMKTFIQSSQLKRHLAHHTGQYEFSCDVCNEQFTNKRKLQIHIQIVHKRKSPLLCAHCPKSFVIKMDMERHIKLHTDSKAFPCEICDKAFAARAYLRTHMLTHNKEPPRACNYCNRAFIRQDCLLRHMRSKHRDKVERILVEAERKKLQLQLMSFTAKDTDLPPSGPPSELAEALPGSISDLLSILVDEDTLRSFGAPDAPVDEVLKLVIKRCGHSPVEDPSLKELDRLRENAKLLFTVVIDDAGVKALLNNQSVDEVIQHVLNLVKS